MATNDLSLGTSDALPSNALDRVFVLKREINCAVNNQAQNDVAKMILIPAGTWVLEVQANVKTAEGATLTVDVGDYLESDDSAVDADGYADGVDGNAVASYSSKRTGTANYANGKLYTSDSYIGILFNDAADAAKIELHIVCVDCNA